MIFEDPKGTRRKWAPRALAMVGVLAATPLLLVIGSLMLAPHWRAILRAAPRSAAPPAAAAASTPTFAPEAPEPEALPGRPGEPLPTRAAVVFANHQDAEGARSIDRNLESIDVIVPDWFRIAGPGCAVEETIDDASRAWLARNDVGLVPRLANLSNDTWSREGAGALVRSAESRRCVIRTVTSRLSTLGADGLNVDFEGLDADDGPAFVTFLGELRDALHASGLRLSVDVTPGGAVDDMERIGEIADEVIVMAYDEHEESSAPGPIATRKWLTSVLTEAMARVPPERLIIGLGSYCYDWRSGGGAEALTYRAAMQRAAVFGAKPKAAGADGARFEYADEGGARHEVWCADAPALANQQMLLASRGLARWALWRAGSEDPSLWAALAATTAAERRKALARIPAFEGSSTYGEGEVYGLVTAPSAGERRVVFGRDGSVVRADYLSVPTGRLLRRIGGLPRQVVLTFDDGPDPRGTPAVLDALHGLGVEGTFFVLGEQAMQHPEIVRRITDEGHLLGNHTYHHPHIDELGTDGLPFELRLTERTLEGLAGRYSPLFRAPYTAMFDAESEAEVAAHWPAFEAGYLVVAAGVDPADWSRPGASVIAERIVRGVENGGRIVVLHDGGGDRAQTAEALLEAVPRLRALGYDLAPLHRYLGVPRDLLVQTVDVEDGALSLGARLAAFLRARGLGLIEVLFVTCTGLAACRVALLAFFALRKRRHAAPERASKLEPMVTVLVPAYNEQRVIPNTLRSLLASDYARMEVLVIDDGSVDRTYDVVSGFTAQDPRVRCLRKRNDGKAAAANFGLRHARGSIIVAVDADTVVDPRAVGLLVRRFADPRVSAVCGNVEVGNVRSLLTAFQAIEYVTTQNLDRRALASLNCVSVVPGALGAWRREALTAVGGYDRDTLVEDADLTLTVLRSGGVIEYEPRAIARTEAPESLSALWKQRFRWTYGTYQVLAKHRAAFFRGPLGWIGLPLTFVFNVLFPLLTPLGDAFMISSLVSGQWTALLSGYVGFLAMDVVASFIAFRLDGKPLRWLALLLLQRFVYRPLLCAVSLCAMYAALVGGRQGWRKLERTGNVACQQPRSAASAQSSRTVVS